MAQSRQVLHFVDNGKEYKVIKRRDKNYNDYHIYHIYTDLDENGYPHTHRKLMESYGNLASVWYWFIEHNVGF